MGDEVFLDTVDIEDDTAFPPRLLTAIINARVVVILATATYIERRFCQLEMRLALAAGDASASHLVVALGAGADVVLARLPPEVAERNSVPVNALDRLERLIRRKLDNNPLPLYTKLSQMEAQRLSAAFLEESRVPEPLTLQGMRCSVAEMPSISIGSRFVGRAADLRRIHRVLSEASGGAAPIVLRITAGPGSGKTRLAIEYMHRYGPRFYPGGLFWLNASGSLDVEFWKVLSTLDESVPDLSTMRHHGRDVKTELGRALRNISERALFIADNIPESEPGQHSFPISDFCPAVGAVTVIATSRHRTNEPGEKILPLDALDRDAAILLVTYDLPAAGCLSWDQWGKIAECVGNLPIALDVLNRGLAFESMKPATLLHRAALPVAAAGIANELDSLSSGAVGQVSRNAVHGISQTFQISFAKLDSKSRQLVLVLAQLATEPIPEAFLDALPRSLRSIAVRAALHSRHFVTGGGPLSFGLMHPLMSDFLRARARRSHMALRRACRAVLAVMTPEHCGEPEHWQVLEMLQPHAEVLLERVSAGGSRNVDLTEVGLRAGRLAFKQGEYGRARRLQERVLHLRTITYGEDHPSTLDAMWELAETLRAAGLYTDSRLLHKRVFDLRLRDLGERNVYTITSMDSLASALSNEGNDADAVRIQQRALDLRTQLFGDEDPHVLTAAGNLALILEHLGDYEASHQLQQQVLDKRIAIFGEEHPDTLKAMGNLASVLSDQGNYVRAHDLRARVLSIMSRILGEEHPDTLISMNNLALARWALDDHEGARLIEERLLELRVRILGEEHPHTVTTMGNLAVSLLELGEIEAAKRLQERVLELRTRLLGEGHPTTLAAVSDLAGTLSRRGDHEHAQPLEEHVLAVRRRVQGADHPETLRSMYNLAEIVAAQGEFSRSKELLQATLAGAERVLGVEHPHTLATQASLAWTLLRLGENETARQLFRKCLATHRIVSGDRHPTTLTLADIVSRLA